MSDIKLIVNGVAYLGWKNIRITRTIESLAGSFSLEAHDMWHGQEEPWPIYEEDSCQILLDDDWVIDGYIDTRSPSFGPKEKKLLFSGRDKSAMLVDCDAVLDKWTFRNQTVASIARLVAAQFDIDVLVQPGVEKVLAPKKLVINHGDSAFSVISSAAKESGVMIVSTGTGGILITRASTDRLETALVEGVNILTASASYDASQKFYRYIVAAQASGVDDAYEDKTRIKNEAIDESVVRRSRVTIIKPDKWLSKKAAMVRADWEARVRSARADTVEVSVLGWRQDNGQIWGLNKIVQVRSPTIGIDGDMLISKIVHTAGPDGKISTLSLINPAAFSPSPDGRVRQNPAKKKSSLIEKLLDVVDPTLSALDPRNLI